MTIEDIRTVVQQFRRRRRTRERAPMASRSMPVMVICSRPSSRHDSTSVPTNTAALENRVRILLEVVRAIRAAVV